MIKSRDYIPTCYLLAWVYEQNGQLVVTEADIYSEAPWSITHDLKRSQPMIVSEVSATDGYHEAQHEMIDNIKAELKHYKLHDIHSVRRKILQMAMNNIEMHTP